MAPLAGVLADGTKLSDVTTQAWSTYNTFIAGVLNKNGCTS
jgi:hypothetical protein